MKVVKNHSSESDCLKMVPSVF